MGFPTHVVFTTVTVSRVQARRAVELLHDLAGSYGAEIEASSDGNKDTVNVQSVRSGGWLDTGEQDDEIARALPGVRIVSVLHRLDQDGRYVPVPSTATLATPSSPSRDMTAGASTKPAMNFSSKSSPR